ncbi:DUF389 domain-containing protein [Streptomyces sp. SID11385]|uniref:DUF389 domain-containing protein n=1 Tax=Streptomyces sp. SID11385 TaxID=2706031 RepID=UPI0013CAD20F|nr:DUF389 domain-containing protein [Streptomyces sp. SID11385]NEA39789.1 DUF389 domain-containing protein [Streptomyces sp. SID11385]
MLHVRVIVPARRTEELLSLLRGSVGVTHLVVLSGAAREPAGDLVECEVAREAADELLDRLQEFRLGEDGGITAEHLDLTLSRPAEQAAREAPGDAADAVVWQELSDASNEDATLTVTYLAFLALATMIAACGVMLDNAILVVGAMAIGPEFGPLAGISTSLVRRAPRLAARSLLALVVGFLVAIAVTVLFGLLMDGWGLFSHARLDARRPNTGFVYAPDALSFVVAVLAGIAGTLSLTSSKSGLLVGVAISVTTVPAAANAAVALSYGEFGQMRGSLGQLGLNLFGIVLAGTLTLLAQRLLWSELREKTGGGGRRRA